MEVAVPMCADFVHRGHINLLSVAAQHGKVCVWLMTDAAMESYKRKPYFCYEDRLLVVQSLKFVDEVIPCDGPQQYEPMCEQHKPAVFVHGDDWNTGVQSGPRERVIALMERTGGKVLEPTYTSGVSSTQVRDHHEDPIRKLISGDE